MDVRVIITKTQTVKTTYIVSNVETLTEAGELALANANGCPQDNVAKLHADILDPINKVSTYEAVGW